MACTNNNQLLYLDTWFGLTIIIARHSDQSMNRVHRSSETQPFPTGLHWGVPRTTKPQPKINSWKVELVELPSTNLTGIHSNSISCTDYLAKRTRRLWQQRRPRTGCDRQPRPHNLFLLQWYFLEVIKRPYLAKHIRYFTVFCKLMPRKIRITILSCIALTLS